MEQRLEPYALYFADEMRCGLIFNFRRSWSKRGKQKAIDNRQAFDNRYLFSAVSPLSGDSFHLISIDGFDSNAAYVFLRELKKQHQDELVILVWDNAPCHRLKIHREIPGLIVLFPHNTPWRKPGDAGSRRSFRPVSRIQLMNVCKESLSTHRARSISL